MFRNTLLITLFLCATSFAHLAQPKLELKESSFDFGDIKQGKTVSHTFVIKNTGNVSLKITDVKAACGCTAATPEKKNLNQESLQSSW